MALLTAKFCAYSQFPAYVQALNFCASLISIVYQVVVRLRVCTRSSQNSQLTRVKDAWRKHRIPCFRKRTASELTVSRAIKLSPGGFVELWEGQKPFFYTLLLAYLLYNYSLLIDPGMFIYFFFRKLSV